MFSVEDLANPIISDYSADPDGDGLSNLLEYIFATNPKQANAEPITLSWEYDPEEAENPGLYQIFTLQVSSGLDDVEIKLDSSSNLSNWSAGTEGTTYEFLGSEIINSDARTLQFRTSQPAEETSTNFYRFSFSLQ